MHTHKHTTCTHTHQAHPTSSSYIMDSCQEGPGQRKRPICRLPSKICMCVCVGREASFHQNNIYCCSLWHRAAVDLNADTPDVWCFWCMYSVFGVCTPCFFEKKEEWWWPLDVTLIPLLVKPEMTESLCCCQHSQVELYVCLLLFSHCCSYAHDKYRVQNLPSAIFSKNNKWCRIQHTPPLQPI